MRIIVTRQNGFTLIELMVTVAILIITAAVVVPPVGSFFDNLRLRSSTRALYADLNLAKISAMKTLVPYTLLLGGTSGTQEGWIVFSDQDDDGVLDGGEKQIRNVTLQDNLTVNSGLGTAITFDKDGLLNRGVGTYILKSADATTINLTVSLTGYMTID